MSRVRLKTKKRIVNDSKGVKKLKSRSAAKKRFASTASGLVIASQANKQHGMIKRSQRQIKRQRGTTVLAANVSRVIRKFFNLTFLKKLRSK